MREVGLGATHSRSLSDARKLAEAMRGAIADHEDPAAIVRNEQQQDDTPATFETCAMALIESKHADWRNAKHA